MCVCVCVEGVGVCGCVWGCVGVCWFVYLFVHFFKLITCLVGVFFFAIVPDRMGKNV